MSQKRKVLNLVTKGEIIKKCDGGHKKADVAKEYGIPPSSLSTILKNRAQILAELSKSEGGSKRKKMRSALYPDVEEALFNWFTAARAQNIPISGPILQEKARNFGSALGYKDFEAGTGWLQRFKDRHNISCQTLSGEASSADVVAIKEWIEKNMDRILKDYSASEIYNADETGLFYQMVPEKTMAIRGEKCEGGKRSKQRISVLLCANMDGSDKRKPLIVGKSLKPRCFKGMDMSLLPVTYRNNKKSWMTQNIFREWLVTLDREMAKKGRKILMLVDNCTAHNVSPTLTNVKLEFLPPNTTSKFQPMDQGVIANFKIMYRRYVIERLLLNLEKGSVSDIKIDLRVCLDFVRRAWNNVRAETLKNCFHKAGFCSVVKSAIPSDESDCDEVQDPSITEMWEKIVENDLAGGATLQDFYTADDEVLISPPLSDAEILAGLETKASDFISDSDSDNEGTIITEPEVSAASAISSLENVAHFLMSRGVYNEKTAERLDFLEKLVMQQHTVKKQCSLDTWLIKK